MPNGKAGDQVPWSITPHTHLSGHELIARIAREGGVLPMFAEDAVREILSFATTDQREELAQLLDRLYNQPDDHKPVEVVRRIRELRDRLREGR